jgi:hypothetical protein
MDMSPQAKEEYIEALYKRYKEASRQEKTSIINECCATCGYHRKHAIRRLRGYKRFTKPRKKKKGKPPVYNKEVIIRPLKQIWLAARECKSNCVNGFIWGKQ